MQPRLDARLRPVALVLHGADHGFGNGKHALRTAGEVEVAMDVGARQRTEAGLASARMPFQSAPRSRRRARRTAARGHHRKHERDGHVAAAVAVRDEMTECFGHGTSPPFWC
jgi:hypothetical protein